MKNHFIGIAALLLAALPAWADSPRQWQVDPLHSKISFTGEQSGVKFAGGFRTFDAAIAFDPEHPENGKIIVTIDTGSAYAGSADRDQLLPQSDWFNSAAFPQAQFASTSIRKTGPWKYIADGVLTIKGITKNVSLPFTLAPSTALGNGYMHATGDLTLSRHDFGLGQGSFASEDYVKYPVTVQVDIEAK